MITDMSGIPTLSSDNNWNDLFKLKHKQKYIPTNAQEMFKLKHKQK